MATTDEELQNLQSDIAEKRKSLEDKQRKSAELQRLIQNDQTKSALAKELENLDIALAQADEHIKALEDASGVSADSIELRVTRGSVASSITASAESVAASTESTGDSTASPSSSKRGSK